MSKNLLRSKSYVNGDNRSGPSRNTRPYVLLAATQGQTLTVGVRRASDAMQLVVVAATLRPLIILSCPCLRSLAKWQDSPHF